MKDPVIHSGYHSHHLIMGLSTIPREHALQVSKWPFSENILNYRLSAVKILVGYDRILSHTEKFDTNIYNH